MSSAAARSAADVARISLEDKTRRRVAEAMLRGAKVDALTNRENASSEPGSTPTWPDA